MGDYLSAPIVDKESSDEQCNGFTYGASCMQGWRVSQEDAHNCIPEFDNDGSSFFAVYDGHGGPEVANYTHLKFPDFVKSLIKKNKEGDFVELIQSAFLDFDATLTEEDVIKKLKELAGKDDENDDEEDPDVPVGRTEADMLKAEADMPLEELLAKYSKPNSEGTDKIVEGESSGSACSQLAASSVSSSSSSPTEASSSHTVNGPIKANEESCENNNNANGMVGVADQSGGGSQSKSEPECSPSGDASGGSGSGTEMGQRASKTKAASDIAVAHCLDDDDDDDDSSEEEEDDEEGWEDTSDDEEEEMDEEEPMMDMTNEEPGSDSGCTACVVLKQKNKLYVANAGDSRCVLSRDGIAVEMSFDHKPEDDPERERIEKAGGKVTADGRVNGGLNLSRAFGDHVYKRNKGLPSKDQMISALPDVKTIELGSSDEFFVIACDGIWNFMSSQEVVDYVKERLADCEKRKKPSLICEEMFDHCLAPNILGDGTGCDNMTCVIVVLEPAQHLVDTNHKDGGVEMSDEIVASDESDNSLKRLNDISETEDPAKKVKMGEDTG